MSFSAVFECIPERFKTDYDTLLLAKGTIIVIIFSALLQFCVSIALMVLKYDFISFGLNLGFSLFAAGMIFAIRYFRTIEAFINTMLGGGYVLAFAFIVYEGGIYSNIIYWLGILLTANIYFTKLRHTYFWSSVIVIFLVVIFLLPKFNLALSLEPVDYSYSNVILNVVSYFLLLLIIALVYSGITIKKKKYHLSIIAELERVNKDRNELINFISHDLRSPYAKIKGLVNLLEKSEVCEQKAEIIAFIKKSNEQSNVLIQEILTPYSATVEPGNDEVEIGCFLNELAISYKPMADEKNIKLDFTFALIGTVHTCRLRLFRIVDNLLSNAIKYTKKGGKISVSAKEKNNFIIITIQDEGPGFTEQDKVHLFAKPGKRSAQPTGNEVSHGLGLSIVKKLSDEINVEVKLKESMPTGSTFEVILPML
jgi:signal transduction histidine kinase